MARTAELLRTIPPAPATRRGFGSSLDSLGERLLFTAGTCVFLSSLSDLARCEVFREHLQPTTCARFSPSGAFVASGDESGHMKVWFADTQTVRLQLDLFNGPVKDIAWSEDEQRIVAVGQGKQSYGRVVMADSGNNIGEISGHSCTLLTCAFRPVRPFRVFTAGEDFLVNVFNGPPFRLTKSHRHHTNYVNCVRYAKDGQKAVSVGSDKKILILSGDSGEIVREVPSEGGHTGSIVGCSWLDAETFATCGLDKSVRVWTSAGLQRTFTVGSDILDQQVAVVSCESRLVSLSLRGALNVWGAELERVSQSHQGKITHLAWRDGSLITVDFNGSILARANCGETAKSVACMDAVAVDMRVRDDWIAAVGIDGKVSIWNVATGAAHEMKVSDAPMNLCFEENGVILLADGKAMLLGWDCTVTAEFPLPQNACRLERGTNCYFIALGSALHRYSLGFQSEAAFPPAHRSQVTDLRLSPSGDYLASSDAERLIFIWSAASCQLLQSRMVYHTSRVTQVSWSPDSQFLVSGSLDKSVIVWKVLQDDRLIIQDAHRLGVTAVLARNGEVVSTGEDLTVKVWRVPSF